MHTRRKLICAACLLVYFFYFTYDGLGVHFAVDDIGNMAHYFRAGPLSLLTSQFTLWRGDYRPMGGLFYLPILHFAGLNPVPFQAALLLILLCCVYLIYRLAAQLGSGELAAALTALAVCYHAGLHNLYYNAAFIFDAMCCFFYAAALLCYVRRSPALLFLALYLCALNSKEMAVTLPLMLVVYEWIYHRRWRPTGTLLLACALTLIDVYGKLFGPDALAGAEAYRPVFLLRRVRDFQRAYLGDLLFGWGTGWGGILLLYAVMAYLAWRRDRPILRFCWWWTVLTPLPIEFLLGRSQACFYVPLVGWAVFAAVILVDLVRALAPVLEREPFGRFLGRRGIAALLLAGALFLWARQNSQYKEIYAKPVMASLGHENWGVIQQFRALNPHVRPGSKIAFLDDPFHSWDMLFLAQVWFRDRTLDIHVQRHGPLSPQEMAQTDSIFTFENGKLIQLK